MKYYLSRSDRKNKKYKIQFVNEDTGRINSIHFGDNRYEDFTIHKDKSRRDKYDLRHQNENWTSLSKSGTWAKYLLWNKPSLDNSIRDMKKRFNISIIKQF